MRILDFVRNKAVAYSLAGVAMAGGVGTIGFLEGLQLSGNFHPVIEGEAYRSAQPSAADLERYVQAYGIKTVINLRGENDGAQWYEDELSTSQRLGVNHVDFRMSAKRELSQDEAAKLIQVLEGAQRPILIHCRAGSDRSGLASALYVAAVKHGKEEDAEGHISLRYGHISLPVSETYAMDRTFEALEPWLGYENS